MIDDKIRELEAKKASARVDADISLAEAKVTKLSEELDTKLANKHFPVNIDTTKASADVGAFATTMTAKLDAAIKALPAVKITGDSTDADRAIDEVRNQLQDFRNVTVTGKFDNAKMIADIKAAEAELKALEDKKVNVQVTADTKSARSELSQLTAEADKSTNAFQRAGCRGFPDGRGDRCRDPPR